MVLLDKGLSTVIYTKIVDLSREAIVMAHEYGADHFIFHIFIIKGLVKPLTSIEKTEGWPCETMRRPATPISPEAPPN